MTTDRAPAFAREASPPVVGRLAPTPSGRLHLGNALAFAAAWLSARSAGGRVLLRIEDVDTRRARAEIASSQREDLQWLGLLWDEETPPQSTRDYQPWIQRLSARTYRCACTRRQVREAGGRYPGTCRDVGRKEGKLRLRLDDVSVRFYDRRFGERSVRPARFGDPVLQRRDGLCNYSLAVVADDLRDGVSEVVRGADLLDFTAVQVLLWTALGATPPTWLHAPLLLGPDGRKLSKSHGALELASLRGSGWTAGDVWRLLLPMLGLPGVDSLAEARERFDPRGGPLGPIQLDPVDPHAPPGGIHWRIAPGDASS